MILAHFIKKYTWKKKDNLISIFDTRVVISFHNDDSIVNLSKIENAWKQEINWTKSNGIFLKQKLLDELLTFPFCVFNSCFDTLILYCWKSLYLTDILYSINKTTLSIGLNSFNFKLSIYLPHNEKSNGV